MKLSSLKFSIVIVAAIAAGLMVGSTRAANLASVSIALSNHKPSQTGVTETISFKPVTGIAAPGDLKITWPAGFDLTNVIASADVTVNGGGVTWDGVVNGNLASATRVLTLGWSSGSLTPGSTVTVTVGFTKNPTIAGNYDVVIQTGTDGFSTATDSRTVPVVIVDGGVAVTAAVPYPETNPTITNITPVETIVVSSGATQVITFELKDVNDNNLDYTVTPSTGAISVSPTPASPIITATRNGVTITFTYFANGATGNQTITVTADDNEATFPAVVTYNIQLFII